MLPIFLGTFALIMILCALLRCWDMGYWPFVAKPSAPHVDVTDMEVRTPKVPEPAPTPKGWGPWHVGMRVQATGGRDLGRYGLITDCGGSSGDEWGSAFYLFVRFDGDTDSRWYRAKAKDPTLDCHFLRDASVSPPRYVLRSANPI